MGVGGLGGTGGALPLRRAFEPRAQLGSRREPGLAPSAVRRAAARISPHGYFASQAGSGASLDGRGHERRRV